MALAAFSSDSIVVQAEEVTQAGVQLCASHVGPSQRLPQLVLPHEGAQEEEEEQDFHHQATQLCHGEWVRVVWGWGDGCMG